eukprot:1139169-Lingulodinium_polyedra.AAC.1
MAPTTDLDERCSANLRSTMFHDGPAMGCDERRSSSLRSTFVPRRSATARDVPQPQRDAP